MSAGDRAWWTAIKFSNEAAASSTESTSVESILTEPVITQAANLAAINTPATETEAYVAAFINRADCSGEARPEWRAGGPDFAV